MPIDIARQIGAITREISSCEKNGATARRLIATRDYTTDIDDLWDALTNPERIPRWFMPISGDLRLGGKYQLQGNASGEIVECTPPRRLGLTWGMQGQVSWVTVELSPGKTGGTHLQLEHIAHVPDEMWNQFGPGAVGVGWDLSLLGLDRHLGTGAAVDPKEAMAWPTSPEGRAFVGGSSDGWRDASIAAGADAETARAAGSRTTAFYTGDPAPPTGA